MNMRFQWHAVLAICVTLILHSRSNADIYVQHKNIVYVEVHGVGMVMDIFVPVKKKNGLAIIDVVSGGWSSSRGKINDQKRAKLFDTFCEYGYTVFAIRPGSVSKFTGLEMLDNLQKGIRWVEDHANDYDVDPKKFGMVGASAGGHLACLAAVTRPKDSPLSAVGVFFPPTDLIEFAGGRVDIHSDSKISQILRGIGFNDRLDGVTDKQARETLTKLSPARLVTGTEPPFLLIHGDADSVVPLSQSQLMTKALHEKGVSAKLIVKPGGGHPWLTIHEEVAVLAEWMDENLRP